MAIVEQGNQYVSLAPLCGENSMEAWTHALLENRRCMDCKVELAEEAGTAEFRGQIPHVEFIGHLCQPCWDRREEARRYQQGGR